MAAHAPDWFEILDIDLALKNLRTELTGDWYRDPWLWPELTYLVGRGRDLISGFLASTAASPYSLIDVPKENWGTRPAVVMNPLDRLCYQALVDRASFDLIGDLTPNAFGWRLSAVAPEKGKYSHNTKQWEFYRDHLSRLSDAYPVALKSDIASFFASIQIPRVQEEIETRCPINLPTKKLCELLARFEQMPHRSGLPQRSTASAVLANVIMGGLDDVLVHHSAAVPSTPEQKVSYRSFARWMDDVWLFVGEESSARSAQVDLQSNAMQIGLNLNSAKTEVITGDRVEIEAKEIEHSAIESALFYKNDHRPLEELVDRIIEEPERAARPSVRFAMHRMVERNSSYRALELAECAKRMPHVADALATAFRVFFTHDSLQEWFLENARGEWSIFEWPLAYYGAIFGSVTEPLPETLDFFEGKVATPSGALPLFAVACRRLAEWRPQNARAIFRTSAAATSDPGKRRVLALAALNAGESRSKVRSWLIEHDSNRVTLKMLEERNFVPVSFVAS